MILILRDRGRDRIGVELESILTLKKLQFAAILLPEKPSKRLFFMLRCASPFKSRKNPQSLYSCPFADFAKGATLTGFEPVLPP